MADKLYAYSIDFKGLEVGKHIFEFLLDDAFFAEYPEGEISEGHIETQIMLHKQNNLMELTCNMSGTVQVECDRCLERFALPIEYNGTLFVKTGNPQTDSEPDVIFISEHEHRLNLAQYLYENTCLSLPIRRYHGLNGTNANDCDADMLERMNHDDQNPAEPTTEDPRWAKLKELKNK